MNEAANSASKPSPSRPCCAFTSRPATKPWPPPKNSHAWRPTPPMRSSSSVCRTNSSATAPSRAATSRRPPPRAMPTPPNSCAKSSDLRAQAPSRPPPPRPPPAGAPLFCVPPRRVAAPRPAECRRVPAECRRVSRRNARPFAPARKPCNALAPTFGDSPCNVSDIVPRRRQSPTFALSKRNHPSPAQGKVKTNIRLYAFPRRNLRPLHKAKSFYINPFIQKTQL